MLSVLPSRMVSNRELLLRMENHDANPYASPTMCAARPMSATQHDADFWLEGALSACDVQDAAQLRAARPAVRRLIVGGMLGLLVVMLGALALLGAYLKAFGFAVSFGCIAAFLAVTGYVEHRLLSKCKNASEHMRIAITAEGIRFVNEYEDVMQRWSAFSKFRASPRVVLLYFGHNPKFVRIISRSWFSVDSEWSRFLAYVANLLPAG